MKSALRPDVVLCLPIETCEKIRVTMRKSVARCFTPCIAPRVPDSPDPDKEILGIRIERTLKRRIQIAAKSANKTVTEFVREILVKETAHVTLTSKDYAKIAEKVRKAEEKQLSEGKRKDAR